MHVGKLLLRLCRGSDCFGCRRKTTAYSFLSETILPWPSLCKMELESLAENRELAGAITQPIHHNGSLVSNKQVINVLSVHLQVACVPPLCPEPGLQLLARRRHPG